MVDRFEQHRPGTEIKCDQYQAKVWVNPPEDVTPGTDWCWTPLWHSGNDSALDDRPFGSHTKVRGALGAELYIYEPTREEETATESSPADPRAVETRFRKAVDACLEAGVHLPTAEPFSMYGYGPSEMEEFFNRLDDSVIPEREYKEPICQTDQFARASTEPRDEERLPPLLVDGLDRFRVYAPKWRREYKNGDTGARQGARQTDITNRRCRDRSPRGCPCFGVNRVYSRGSC